MKREIIQANLPIPEPEAVLADLLEAFPGYQGKAYANGIIVRRDLLQADVSISRKKGSNSFELAQVRLNNRHPAVRIGGTSAVIITLLLLTLAGNLGRIIGIALIFVISFVMVFVGFSQKGVMVELRQTLTNYLLQKYDGAIKGMR